MSKLAQIIVLFQLLCIIIVNTAPVNPQYYDEDDPLIKLQNESARYEFSTNIEDHISDQTQSREEVRDGLNVQGKYSYSDGNYMRTVHYVADQNGFRVLHTDVVPLDGPQFNPSGTASISTYAHGEKVNYSIKSVPINEPIIKTL